MLYTDIVKQFNVLLAGDNLPLREVLPHLDYTIDRINETLNTCYPTFSEYRTYLDEAHDVCIRDKYDLFIDKYIRQVCIKGAAWHYYVTDEEGLQTAPQYSADFENALFVMQRDMLYNIPEEYQADVMQGTVATAIDHWNLGDRSIECYSSRLI